MLVGGAITIVTNLITWVLASKKRNADVNAQVIDNMGHSLSYYQNMVDDMKKDYEELKVKYDIVIEQNEEMKSKLDTLMLQLKALKQFNCINTGCKQRKSEYDMFGNSKIIKTNLK